MKSAQYWIDHLGLEAHPEGGFFKEVYRSSESFPASGLPSRFKGDRSHSTSIYFLIKQGFPSKFHKILSDEIWHFYYGNPISIFILDEKSGDLQIKNLGQEPEHGQHLQLTVPKESWFGTETSGDYGYALVGCTVAPGFDFKDFELAKQSELLEKFPQHTQIIHRLT